MRSFTEPPGLRYSTLASTIGPSSGRPSSDADSRRRGVLPISSRSEFTYRMPQGYAWGPLRNLAGVGTVGAARKLAAAAAYGGGGLSVLGLTLYGLLRAEAKL